MPVKKAFTLVTWSIYAFSTLQFIRYYVVSTTFYLNMPRYLSGRERLPFQARILPLFLMWPINHSSYLMRHLSHPDRGWDSASAATPEMLAFYLVSLVSFAAAGFFVVQLYRAVSPAGALVGLVYPLFMVLTMCTYVVHIDANFSYPYDMPSLAFFAGGLLAIYSRHFLPLVAVMFFGTMNRETTLFLVGIYILDAATRDKPRQVPLGLRRPLSFRDRFSPAQVPWLRAALLLAIWVAVEAAIYHHFATNDRSEDYVRFKENLPRLNPRLWPILFNICGYVLPVIVILRARLSPLRFANYLYILPLWIAVVFYTGVILESRVYGELCTFTAVAAVLLIEERILRVNKSARVEDLGPQLQAREPVQVLPASQDDYAA